MMPKISPTPLHHISYEWNLGDCISSAFTVKKQLLSFSNHTPPTPESKVLYIMQFGREILDP